MHIRDVSSKVPERSQVLKCLTGFRVRHSMAVALHRKIHANLLAYIQYKRFM